MPTRYNPERHHRHSIRLKGYDYTRAGAYFITINTQNNTPLFGEIINAQMHLNDAGTHIQQIWEEIPTHYPSTDIDLFIVMPNHIHGIIILEGHATQEILYGQTPVSAPKPNNPTMSAPNAPNIPTPAPSLPPLSLSAIVQRFKSLTTKRYTEGVHTHQWPTFPGRLWHRNYYEHIIRNEKSLNAIREYILQNPARWGDDPTNDA